MRVVVLAVAFAGSAVAGSLEATEPGPPAYSIEQAPARLAASVERANVAMGALQRRLAGRLLEELQKGGPALAVSVCRDEAQALTAEIGRSQGVQIGRTSHRLRNPGNAAPAWAARRVAAAAGRKAASVQPVVVDLGARVGVLRPLPTAAPCVQCHGPKQRLAPEVRALIESAYPDDRAVGFEEGDLRGFIWVELPVAAAASADH